MKFKNFLFTSLNTGILISLLLGFTLVNALYYENKPNNPNLEIQDLNDSWKVYLDCYPQDMAIDSNNNIYVVGCDRSQDCSLELLKYDSSGAQLFNKYFSDLIIDNPYIKLDSHNNLYLAGFYMNEAQQYLGTLIKFNTSGDLEWQQILESENIRYISDLTLDSEDNIYLYCDWTSNDVQNQKILVIKFNNSGNQISNKTLEESSKYIRTGGIEIDSENNLIVSGSYYDKQYMYWIKCYSESGILKWSIESKFKTYPLFVLDSSDNIITIRVIWDNINYDTNLVLFKYNNSGALLWNYTIDSKYTDYFYNPIPTPMIYQYALTADNSDNIYVTWDVEIPNDSYKPDILMIKLNESGKFEWYLTWGGSEADASLDIKSDLNNNIYLCSDRYLIKNPISNGKSFYRTNLWYFLISLFGVFCFISLITLYFIIKPKIKKRSNSV